jgi:hypothetical protein
MGSAAMRLNLALRDFSEDALRRMDEILAANFMLFHDIVREWIGDEAWELDYYLHENPMSRTSGCSAMWSTISAL